jgi:hypothetical protein
MKYKKLATVLITCLITASFLLAGTACAQDEELPNPGITPDSPFYFFDKLGKNVGMFFTFGPENKARKALQYAEERLAEVRVMAAKNKPKELEEATGDYDEFMAMVNERIREVESQDISDNITERVARAISRHLSVLDDVRGKVPEKADEAVARVREESINRQLNTLRKLANTRVERALDISSDAIDRQLERVRGRASLSDNITDNTTDNTTNIEEALDYATRIAELEEEMAAIAEEKGIDITAIQQRLAHSTSNRLEVLSGVYEKVPVTAQAAIENAIENSVRKYERTVDKLREKNALGEISANATTTEMIPEKIRERLKINTSNRAQVLNNTGNQSPTENAWIEPETSHQIPPEMLRPHLLSANNTEYRQEDTETSRVRVQQHSP